MDLHANLERFRGPLVGLMASWGVPIGEAVELAQESFADAYLSRDACRGDCEDPTQFGAWLRGVARNRFLNWRRARGRRERRVLAIDPALLDTHAAQTLAEEDQRLVELRSAIDRLPAKRRQVVLMHYLEETSVRDVATLLSVTEKTVEGRLYQARKQLKRMMQPTSSATIGRALLL